MHQNKHQNTQTTHIPVLLEPVLKYLDPKPGNSYLDLTAGYGGHAEKILERTLYHSSVLVDRDTNAVDFLLTKFKQEAVEIKHQSFLEASRELVTAGQRFDVILADLGVSSPHLNMASRGFSIQQDGPLDMRMDSTQSLDAATLVNKASESELADIFKTYGEEPRANMLAREIVLHRPLRTTAELASLVARSLSRKNKGGKPPKVHPATKVFQALRIAVNDELGQLTLALPMWIEDLLNPGGRLAVISFHSLEDRLVKQAFANYGGDTYDAILQIVTKHPVEADQTELVFNPRARSAKLRVAVKIKNKKEREG